MAHILQTLIESKSFHLNINRFSKHNFTKYLSEHNFPKIDEEQRQLTNDSLSIMELIEAICNQKNGKTPGPDGILAEFYHKFNDIISEKLKDFLSAILDGSQLSESWRHSTTMLIPKEGKEKDDIANYCPTALLNVDYKIFATIIANCLSLFLYWRYC